MSSQLERTQALQKFADQLVQKYGEKSQYLLAHDTFGAMDRAYQNYRDVLSDPRAAALEGVSDFNKMVGLQAIEFFREAFKGGFKGLEQVGSGAHADESWKGVEDLADVYTCLIEEKDPDGKLKEFLEQYPGFTEHIGGIPEWLKGKPSLLGSS